VDLYSRWFADRIDEAVKAIVMGCHWWPDVIDALLLGKPQLQHEIREATSPHVPRAFRMGPRERLNAEFL